jgi:hypothetical protein
MKVALQGTQPVALPGGSQPSGLFGMAGWPTESADRRTAARASDNGWIPPSPRERGMLSRLFGN